VSGSAEAAEDLLSYFLDIDKECFSGVLYMCFDLSRADVVMELSWQHGLNDFYMQYQIRSQQQLIDKVQKLENDGAERMAKATEKGQQEADSPIIAHGLDKILIITRGARMLRPA